MLPRSENLQACAGRPLHVDPVEKWIRNAFQILVGTLVTAYFCVIVSRECNPYMGTYEVVEATHNGERVPSFGFRLWLTIDTDGMAKVSDYWTCGVTRTTFCQGRTEVDASEIRVLEESGMWVGKGAPAPAARFKRLGKGRVGGELATNEGPVQVVFERVENAETPLDVFGWK